MGRTTGIKYWPGYIAWYALVQLGHYIRGKGQRHLDIFLKQLDWLEEHALCRADGAVVWTMDFDYPESGVLLRAPWISAHAQGLAISAVVRGWRLTRRPELWDLLLASAKIFDLGVFQGGIRVLVDGSTFYTEVPGGPLPGILDGFMTALLGLYDLYVETDDSKVGELLKDGIHGLTNLLSYWDRKNWSWYGCREYLSPPAYHCLNRLLLTVLRRLCAAPYLTQCAARWNPANLTRTERTEIYLAFLATKNFARLRHRTWVNITAALEGDLGLSGTRGTESREPEAIDDLAVPPL